jgi:hypothetical protein
MLFKKWEERMLVRKTSILSGVERVREMDVTQEQLQRWASGEKVQNVFPHLSADDREFIMTGVTGEEWEEFWEESARDEFIYEL